MGELPKEYIRTWLSWPTTTHIVRRTWGERLGFHHISKNKHLISNHFRKVTPLKFKVQPCRADSKINNYLQLNPQPPLHAKIYFMRLLQQAIDDRGGNLTLLPSVRRTSFSDSGLLWFKIHFLSLAQVAVIWWYVLQKVFIMQKRTPSCEN